MSNSTRLSLGALLPLMLDVVYRARAAFMVGLLRRLPHAATATLSGMTLPIADNVHHPAPFLGLGFTDLQEAAVACLPHGASVLEIGTGAGFWSLFAARAGFSVTATDLPPLRPLRSTAPPSVRRHLLQPTLSRRHSQGARRRRVVRGASGASLPFRSPRPLERGRRHLPAAPARRTRPLPRRASALCVARSVFAVVPVSGVRRPARALSTFLTQPAHVAGDNGTAVHSTLSKGHSHVDSKRSERD